MTMVLTTEQRREHAVRARAHGSTKKYAEEHGLNVTTVYGWMKAYAPVEKKKAAITVPATNDLADAHAEILSLRHINDELQGRLEDALTKVRSLQNVVVVLGHQVGDD